jgi:hypothetical protein
MKAIMSGKEEHKGKVEEKKKSREEVDYSKISSKELEELKRQMHATQMAMSSPKADEKARSRPVVPLEVSNAALQGSKVAKMTSPKLKSRTGVVAEIDSKAREKQQTEQEVKMKRNAEPTVAPTPRIKGQS